MVKYSAEAIAGVREGGYGSRRPALEEFANSMGAKVESMDFTFPSEWDFVMVMSAPSTAEVLALSSFAAATGVVERSAILELFTAEEMDSAIAGSNPQYTPPGG